MSVIDKIILNGTTYELGGSSGEGLSTDLKAAMDQIAQKVAYIDDDGQDYYDALHSALYPPANLSYISAVYTQSGAVYVNTPLDDLKPYIVVTAHYSNGTTATVTSYTLSGTLTVGTSVITVSYGGKTTTVNVTVSEAPDTRVKLYDWNFKNSLIDSVSGQEAVLTANVTRDSSGLTIPQGDQLVKLANVTNTQYTIEIDIGTVTNPAGNSSEKNLFCIAQENYAGSRVGLWFSTYWGYRNPANSNSTNAMENNTDITIFNGKTLKAKIDYTNRSIKVYSNNVLVCDFSNHSSPNGRTYVGLGGTYNGNVAMTVTACRIYEGVD